MLSKNAVSATKPKPLSSTFEGHRRIEIFLKMMTEDIRHKTNSKVMVSADITLDKIPVSAVMVRTLSDTATTVFTNRVGRIHSCGGGVVVIINFS